MAGEITKQAHEMTFAEFAMAVRPSGAVNRLPQIGTGEPVVSYSVYMNGPSAKNLPGEAQEHHFKDMVLHALTEKLGLDSESFRDNLKVAEVVATRSAWMTAVLESSIDRTPGRLGQGARVVQLSDEVVKDYEMLSQGNGLSHPWIQGQIRSQLAMSKNLQPALDAAEKAVGAQVVERIPREIERGKIVSQNMDFTVQEIGDGEVVAHENRRLASVPEVGKTVTVTYYRGQGQVIENTRELKMTDPYVDKTSGDLAVNLVGKQGEVKEVVLFNGVSSFAKFVEEHKLSADLVEKAIAAREAAPKIEPPARTPERIPASELYFDKKQEALAFDYIENGRKHTVLFSDVRAIERKASDYGIQPDQIKQAESISRAMEHAQATFPGDKARQHEFVNTITSRMHQQRAESRAAEQAQAKENRGKEDQNRVR